jgi:hypothetical protein
LWPLLLSAPARTERLTAIMQATNRTTTVTITCTRNLGCDI